MEALYPWIVFVHVVGGFAFAIAHGASAAVALRLRRESELDRVRALLDLSQASTGAMYGGLLLLLVGGVAGAFVAGLWGRGWIWTAIVLLVVLLVFMYVRAIPYFAELRRAAGQPYFLRGPHEAEPVNTERLSALLATSRPMELAAGGYLGLLAILWLMFFKPF
jgi:MFS family permease